MTRSTGAKGALACSVLLLVAFNVVLLAGGILVVYAALSLRHNGWLTVLDAYWSATEDVLTAMVVVGSVVMALALLGAVSACCRWRLGLVVYVVVVSLMLLVFAALAVGSFLVRHTAEDWDSKTYPAQNEEQEVKQRFDQVYCYAQGAYVCNSATLDDAAAMFLSDVNVSMITALVGDVEGVNGACDQVKTLSADAAALVQPMCDQCDVAREVQNLSSVLDWANDECPRTSKTLRWCGEFLVSGDVTAATAAGTAPYTQCRSEFLGFISNSTLLLGAGAVLVSASALLVVVLSCVLRRKEQEQEEQYDHVDHLGTPQTTGAYGGTPQTSQPIYSKV